MKKFLFAWACFFLPTILLRFLSSFLGHTIPRGARIGFTFLAVDELSMKSTSRIGNFNFIRINKLVLEENAYVGLFNYINGPVSVFMQKYSGIGNQNRIYRGPLVVRNQSSVLRLGVYSKITARHSVECLLDVSIGDYSILAGSGTQIWTHGYYHYPVGLDRFRIDGRVVIGNNVYIGASCVISMGVTICDAVSIGSHSSVAKSITEPGLYVSQPLRHIPMTPESVLSRLDPLPEGMSIERAYEKK